MELSCTGNGRTTVPPSAAVSNRARRKSKRRSFSGSAAPSRARAVRGATAPGRPDKRRRDFFNSWLSGIEREDNLFKLEEEVDRLVQEVKVLRDANMKKLKNTQNTQTRN